MCDKVVIQLFTFRQLFKEPIFPSSNLRRKFPQPIRFALSVDAVAAHWRRSGLSKILIGSKCAPLLVARIDNESAQMCGCELERERESSLVSMDNGHYNEVKERERERDRIGMRYVYESQ